MMNTFYKRAWEVLFIIFYPFITLFSLLFIGLVNVISLISSFFAGGREEASQEPLTRQDGWEPFVNHHGLYLSRKPVHQVQFGPVLYHFRSNPSLPGFADTYWSDFTVEIGEGFLLQRWPSIAEHELERFELVYVRPGLHEPFLVATMPTFYWQANELSHEQVEIRWNEEEDEKVLFIDEEQLP